MKKVTRDFWIDKNFDPNKHNHYDLYICSKEITAYPSKKVTLTWEEPEKTVTLTESQFDDIWNTTPYFAGEFKKDLKAKLFGGE